MSTTGRRGKKHRRKPKQRCPSCRGKRASTGKLFCYADGVVRQMKMCDGCSHIWYEVYKHAGREPYMEPKLYSEEGR